MVEMNTGVEIQLVLRELFRSQRFAVLATDKRGRPFASLMAFAASPTCAIVRVKISSYQVASRFQDVVEWRVGS